MSHTRRVHWYCRASGRRGGQLVCCEPHGAVLRGLLSKLLQERRQQLVRRTETKADNGHLFVCHLLATRVTLAEVVSRE